MSLNQQKGGKTYRDLIDYNPHFIQNINSDHRELISKHQLVVSLLKQGPRTVKEIHSHYAEKESSKKTLKTIYRYVAELEEANLVKNCGSRMTQGSRIIEQVYCLSSHHYYFNEPSLEWWETQKAREFTDMLSKLLASILNDDRFSAQSSLEIVHQLCKIEASVHYFNTLEIVQKIQRDPEVKSMIPKDYFEENRLIQFVAKLLTYLRKYDELKLFNSIIENE